MFCHLYEDPPDTSTWNQVISIQIIEKLILILCTQFSTNMKSLYRFFEHVFDEKL